MRATAWVIGGVAAAVAIGTAVALLTTSSGPGAVADVAVVAAEAPSGPSAPGDLPLSVAHGARCRPAEAADMLERARATDVATTRHDRLVIVPRAMLQRKVDGVLLMPTTERGEVVGLQLAMADPGSIPADLGFQLLDVVTEAGGRPVRSLDDARAAVARFQGSGITCLRVWRDGRFFVRWLVLEPES